MYKELLVSFILVSVSVIAVIFGMSGIAESSCNSKWKSSGFNSKYEFLSGCLIEVQKNKWIPEKNYREVEDES